MEDKKISWWQTIRKPLGVVGIIVVCLLIIGLIVAITSGYLDGYLFQTWDWTGFKEGTTQITITSKINYSASVEQPYKTLWDWLGLLAILAIPVVVGIGAAWYTAQQGKVSDRENTDNQRETALQKYFDKMSELLLDKRLGESSSNVKVESIARARTATILRILDPVRRGSLIRFLNQSSILPTCIEIEHELVSIDLSRADLTQVNLSGANLNGADLREAILYDDFYVTQGNLNKTDLREADLRKANLGGADLRNTILKGADLSGDFQWVEPSKRNVDSKAATKRTSHNKYGANLTGADITNAKLRNATMHDGSKHE
jgi:Pentapeptide repeats (8 copies)